MMSVLEYASDVSLSVEEILELCSLLGFDHSSEDDMLSEDEIIMLDSEVEKEKEDTGLSDDEIDEFEENARVEDTAEELAMANKWINESNKSNRESHKKQVSKNNDSNKFLNDKKELYKHRKKLQTNNVRRDDVIYKEGMTVSDLASVLDVNPVELIKKLMNLGIMTNINASIGFDEAEMVVVDYNKNLKKEETVDISNFENYEIIDDPKDLQSRPPVITIMGHVDHGKTSLLDYIRKTNVVGGEAGGITQAIGAYQIDYNGNKLTFIDTPGHEAFTAMRARGAQVTDIVIIIVAADDGVMPQTKEAIDHAKAAGVPILVALNKIDKPDADPDRVLASLAEYGLTPEEWGGDVIVTKISAKTGEGVDKLLENIILVSEMQELKANPNRYASGTVLESELDKQTGVKATILVDNGTLRVGDPVVVGTSYGKIRTMKNDKGENVAVAHPSTPVEITGLDALPNAGDKFMAFETERQARQISDSRKERSKHKDTNKTGMSLDELFGAINDGAKEINVVLKTDVTGSEQAVKQSLEKINVEGITVKIIRSGTGTITESDIVLAEASQAIIIGFNVKPSNQVIEFAKDHNVDIRLYNIIYKVVEDMESAMKGMLDPEYEEHTIGSAVIKQLFKFSKVGNIAGCHVDDGKIINHSNARLIRDGIVLYTGKIQSVQREKEQVREVTKGMDCGLTLENYQDIKEGDIIEAFELVQIKR